MKGKKNFYFIQASFKLFHSPFDQKGKLIAFFIFRHENKKREKERIHAKKDLIILLACLLWIFSSFAHFFIVPTFFFYFYLNTSKKV
jgi:hypothetical protein